MSPVLRSGDSLARYSVVSAIGAGGMGEVYKAIELEGKNGTSRSNGPLRVLAVQSRRASECPATLPPGTAAVRMR